jgi:hypothetical protein
MDMASTRVALVDAFDSPDSVTATIPRAEFEAALASEEPAELFLEVEQPQTGTEGERRDISVAWSRAELEQLLARTTDSAITIAFDRDELERLLADDVEAHGMRQKAAVLSIAVVAAAGGAATAAAVPEGGGNWPTPSYVAAHDEAGLSERGIAPLPTSAHDEATLAARGISPAQPVGDGGSGIEVSFDASTAAAVAGGLAGLGLLITAAGFAVRRQRSVHPA